MLGPTERDDNAGSSVTNVAAYLAAAVITRHCPHLPGAPVDEGQPVVRLEHYPPQAGAAAEYDRVTFAPWRSRVDWVGGTLRRALGTPAWARLDRAAVAALLGQPAAGAGER